MLTKIVILAAVLAAGCAQNYNHGSYFSQPSNSYQDIKQDEPLPPPVVPHFTPEDDHVIPVVENVADIRAVPVQQAIPIAQYITPVVQHVAPVVHHVAPVVHHVVPVVHHLTPIVHHFSPAVQHVAPVLHHVAPSVHKVAPVEYKSAPVDHKEEQHEEHFGYPKYEFSYHVEDKHTGDIKSQHESRNGHLVKGEYSLHQPDGSVRTVKYSSDKDTGFNADVHYDGHSKHIEPQHHH